MPIRAGTGEMRRMPYRRRSDQSRLSLAAWEMIQRKRQREQELAYQAMRDRAQFAQPFLLNQQAYGLEQQAAQEELRRKYGQEGMQVIPQIGTEGAEFRLDQRGAEADYERRRRAADYTAKIAERQAEAAEERKYGASTSRFREQFGSAGVEAQYQGMADRQQSQAQYLDDLRGTISEKLTDAAEGPLTPAGRNLFQRFHRDYAAFVRMSPDEQANKLPQLLRNIEQSKLDMHIMRQPTIDEQRAAEVSMDPYGRGWSKNQSGAWTVHDPPSQDEPPISLPNYLSMRSSAISSLKARGKEKPTKEELDAEVRDIASSYGTYTGHQQQLPGLRSPQDLRAAQEQANQELLRKVKQGDPEALRVFEQLQTRGEAPQQRPVIRSNDQRAFDRLPSGAEFVDEYGRPWRKP